jgi:hypothetical protein
MSEPVKKIEKSPESYSPQKPEILNMAEAAQESGTEIKEPYVRINTVESITLKDEIKVVGLSFNKCKQTGSVELDSMVDLYSGDKIAMQDNVKDVKEPETKYAVWANSDLLFGKGVNDFGGQDELYASFTIPAGTYVKLSWNAETFDELVMEAMEKAKERAGFDDFLKTNNITTDSPAVEVYPQEKVYVSAAKYPEMYCLFAVK